MHILPDVIYTIKLSTGDEIVTRVVEELEKTFTITHPLTVIPGQQGINMIRSLFTANPDKPVSISKGQIVLIAVSRDEVQDSYIEATTGIKPVRNSSILMG